MNQKGSGKARHSTRKVNIFRGGGKQFGPKPRSSHAIGLPKKVRVMALRHALSAKAKADQLVVLEKAEVKQPKTGGLRKKLTKLGLSSALIVDGAELQENFGSGRPQHPRCRRAPGTRHQCLRHSAP